MGTRKSSALRAATLSSIAGAILAIAPAAQARAMSVPGAGFGPLAEMVGSCWQVDVRHPDLEKLKAEHPSKIGQSIQTGVTHAGVACYEFDPRRRLIAERVYNCAGLALRAEYSVARLGGKASVFKRSVRVPRGRQTDEYMRLRPDGSLSWSSEYRSRGYPWSIETRSFLLHRLETGQVELTELAQISLFTNRAGSTTDTVSTIELFTRLSEPEAKASRFSCEQGAY